MLLHLFYTGQLKERPMAVPDFQTLMRPVLDQYADGSERPAKEVREALGKALHLSDQDMQEMLPSGRQTRFGNRVAWAHSYLRQAGLLESPRRGIYRLSPRGRDLYPNLPARVDIRYLEQFEEFQEFRQRGGETGVVETGEATTGTTDTVTLTPDEQIRIGSQRLRTNIATELLKRVRLATPMFFEGLVVDLLVKMGYGGSHADAARVVGGAGDGGIDGIIKEDRLGLESIYIQAKRWKDDRVVGRPDIQQFAGALQGHRARKGVFLTTARFSDEARRYAEGLQTTIVLIDGTQLAELMIDYGIAVTEVETVKLLRIDEDYFGEE
jgi:restriction system protein